MVYSSLNIILITNNQRGLNLISKINTERYKIISIICSPTAYDFFDSKNLNIPITSEENINSNESIDRINLKKPDIIIVAGFSQIIAEKLISIPSLGTINLHAGKLPKYRGGSPLNWQIINGERLAGISVILLDKGIDTGNILSEGLIKIEPNDNIKSLHEKANELFPLITNEALEKLRSKEKGNKQDNSCAEYWHQRSDEDGFLDFQNMTSVQIYRITKALSPLYPPAWVIYNNTKLRIRECSIPKNKIKGIPGRVLFLQGIGPYVVCKDFAILLEDYFLEGNNFFKLKHGEYLKK